MEKKSLPWKLPSSSYSSLQNYQKTQVTAALQKFVPNAKTIVDATCHIGGDSLHFTEIFLDAKILAIDIDLKAIIYFIRNAQSKQVMNRIEVIYADCTKYIFKRNLKADFYYFDPPWGGPNYSNNPAIQLYLSGINITDIINMIFENNLTNNVIIKVPYNFDILHFLKNVNGEIHKIDIKKKKMPNKTDIAYSLLHVKPSQT